MPETGTRALRFRRLLLSFAAALLVTGLVGTGLLRLRAEKKAVRDQEVLLGQYAARILAYNAEYGITVEDSNQISDLLTGAAAGLPNVLGAAIHTGEDKLLGQTGETVRALPPLTGFDDITNVGVNGEPAIAFRASVVKSDEVGGRPIGTVVLMLKRDGATARGLFIRRGQFMALNLSYNCEYGVLIRERDQLVSIVGAAGRSAPDVVGISVVDADGKELASVGTPVEAPHTLPDPSTPETAVARDGRPVLLFRAPIRTVSGPEPSGGEPRPTRLVGEARVALAP